MKRRTLVPPGFLMRAGDCGSRNGVEVWVEVVAFACSTRRRTPRGTCP